jgi:hypothetical protein
MKNASQDEQRQSLTKQKVLEMDCLRKEVEKGNYVRAANLAATRNVSKRELLELRKRALWQMGAVCRNAPGTKTLAQQYWLSKEELRELLETMAEEHRRKGSKESTRKRYNLVTGKYLSFEEWLDLLVKDWKKLPASEILKDVGSSTVLTDGSGRVQPPCTLAALM